MRKTYVLDTSAILTAGRQSLFAFQEHHVVIPLVVIKELESKRHDPELGITARSALRALEELRIQNSASLRDGVQITPEGGTLRIEVNHRLSESSDLPDVIYEGKSHDARILNVAVELQKMGQDVVLVSQDLPMRLLAQGVLGIPAEEYRNGQAQSIGYTGMEDVDVLDLEIDELYHKGTLPLLLDVPTNCGVVLRGTSKSALGVVNTDKSIRLVRNRDVFGISGRSAEQRVALDHLMNPEIDIVSLGGPAGTGKTLLALAAGLEQVLESNRFSKLVVFRSLYSVGGQNLGYLPGSESEKMDPWTAAIWDALEAFCSPELVQEIKERELISVLPFTHIRGRTLTDTWTIIDEAQNFERAVLLTALSRIGRNSKVVLAGDVAQRDNLHVGRHDGVHMVIERLSNEPLFAHTALHKSERSRVAELVTRLLDDSVS